MSDKSRTIQHCIQHLRTAYRFTYPDAPPAYGDLVGDITHHVLGIIARSDAPYHDLDHSLQVVLVGQEMLQGRHLAEGDVSPETWLNFIVSLVCHDVGYCRGACAGDQLSERRYPTGLPHRRITLRAGATDASLTAFHVDRGKLFVAEQFQDNPLLDVDQLQAYIERTRFPVAPGETRAAAVDFGGLARAADLIGQLSDPNYLAKMADLFQEFAEIGSHRAMGYHSVENLRASYPRFFWNSVSPYVHQGVRYLELSEPGQSVLSNLYSNVAVVEAELSRLQSPKPAVQRLEAFGVNLRDRLLSPIELDWLTFRPSGDIKEGELGPG